MTAEAFLNFHGVKRLGQKFYERHYERLGLVQKLSSVVATCCGVLLDDKAEIVSVVRELSDARNRLVHPKTKEVNPDAILAAQPPTKHALTVAREAVANIGRFYELFASLDPDSRDIVHAI